MELRADIEIAGTDFVEQADALGIFATVARDVPCDALAEGYVQAELGGQELIVFVGVTTRLRLPELVAINGVHIYAGSERVQRPAMPKEII